MTTNEKNSLLAYAWRLLAKLEEMCELVEFRWIPDRGLYARVGETDRSDETSYPLVFQLAAGGQNQQAAELRLGAKTFDVKSPDEIQRLSVLASDTNFWQAIKSKAA